MFEAEREWYTSHPPVDEQQVWIESDVGGELIERYCPVIDSLFKEEPFIKQFLCIMFEVKCVRVVLSTCIERDYNNIVELQVLGSDSTTGNEMIVRFVVNSVGDRSGVAMYASGVEFLLLEKLQIGILGDIRRLYDRWVMGEDGDFVQIDLESIEFALQALPVILISVGNEELPLVNVKIAYLENKGRFPYFDLSSDSWEGHRVRITRVTIKGERSYCIKRYSAKEGKRLFTFHSDYLGGRGICRQVYHYCNALFEAVQEQIASEE